VARRSGIAAQVKLASDPGSAWRSAGSCSPRATAISPRKCSRKRPGQDRGIARHVYNPFTSHRRRAVARSRGQRFQDLFRYQRVRPHHFFIESEHNLRRISPMRIRSSGSSPPVPEGYEISPSMWVGAPEEALSSCPGRTGRHGVVHARRASCGRSGLTAGGKSLIDAGDPELSCAGPARRFAACRHSTFSFGIIDAPTSPELDSEAVARAQTSAARRPPRF